MQVDPRYFAEPLWKLKLEMGSAWLAEQNKIFNKIMEGIVSERAGNKHKSGV